MIKNLSTRLIHTGLRRVATRALQLKPRGAVSHDVLVLGKVSIQQLALEWIARDVHPWDRELPPGDQAERFCDQALHDTELALRRLFQMVPHIDKVDFRVLEPGVSRQVIIAGNIEREEFLSAGGSPSIRMRLQMMGVRFLMAGDRLVPLAV